jgi:hypothetical protein
MTCPPRRSSNITEAKKQTEEKRGNITRKKGWYEENLV